MSQITSDIQQYTFYNTEERGEQTKYIGE